MGNLRKAKQMNQRGVDLFWLKGRWSECYPCDPLFPQKPGSCWEVQYSCLMSLVAGSSLEPQASDASSFFVLSNMVLSTEIIQRDRSHLVADALPV